jgi:hypothetical protein
MGQPMAADVSWDSPNKRIWRALADPVGQPVRRHHKFLNRFVIFQFDFQDNPLKNAAVSIVIGRECIKFDVDLNPSKTNYYPHEYIKSHINRTKTGGST